MHNDLILALSNVATPLAQTSPWWSGSMAAWIGAVGGSAIGLCGAVVGVLVGAGRARRFILGFVPVLIGLGGLMLMGGVVALLAGQPYGVHYPLLLIGGITVLVFGVNYPVMRRRYQALELRRMQAADVE